MTLNFDLLKAFRQKTLPEGVASGDMSEDSIVLWTRSTAPGDVTFTVYELWGPSLEPLGDMTISVTDTDVPVKVQFTDLAPGTEYLYRVEDAAGSVAWGQFGTAEVDGHSGLTFAVTGDWRGDLTPYPAISNMDEADLDFAVLLGDTIYGDYDTPAGPATTELDGYRDKYQEVYGSAGGENFWADFKATTPVYVMIDDHEVINDFAGGADASTDDRLPETEGYVNDTQAYENGLQAFLEYHPVEATYYGETGDDRTDGEYELYRTQSFGEDAAIFVLDQRSFRDDQIEDAIGSVDPVVIEEFLEASFDPDRTMLGDAQMDQLKTDLLAAEEAGVTWKFVMTPEPIQNLGIMNADSWEGYHAERTELLMFIEENDIDNVVFIAADIHATFVNNLTYATEPGGEQIATSSFEITTGSVAFSPTFGETVIELAADAGLVPEAVEVIYKLLPIAPDTDDLLNDRDDVLEFAFNGLTLAPNGLDPLGLDNNLEQAEGLIDATLVEGDYVSANTFGWTEFDIDAETQALTVTTYGVPAYTPELAQAFPRYVASLEPVVVSQFVVMPELDDAVVPTTDEFLFVEDSAGWDIA